MSFLDSVKSFVSGNALLVGGVALVSLLALLVLVPILGRMANKYGNIKKIHNSTEGTDALKFSTIGKVIKSEDFSADMVTLYPPVK